MKKREILIAVIIALGLAGCRAEKDNAGSTAVNTESSITETASDTAEPTVSKADNKTEEVTESSAPTGSSNRNNSTESITQSNNKPANSENSKTPEPESGKTESKKPPAPTEPESKPEETQNQAESSEPEKQEPEFNIDYYIKLAQEYAVKSGLKLDPQAKYCWDNPIVAGKTCKYTERDIKWYIDRYARLPEITAVWIWAEENGKDYEIYIGYA